MSAPVPMRNVVTDRARDPEERYHLAAPGCRELCVRAGTGVDPDRQRIAADDAARRMDDDRLAYLGTLGIERLLHAQRPAVRPGGEHGSRGVALEHEIEARLPSAVATLRRIGRGGERRTRHRRRSRDGVHHECPALSAIACA